MFNGPQGGGQGHHMDHRRDLTASSKFKFKFMDDVSILGLIEANGLQIVWFKSVKGSQRWTAA